MKVAETLYLLLGVILLAKLALKNIHKKMKEVKLEGRLNCSFSGESFMLQFFSEDFSSPFGGIFDIIPRIFHSREVFSPSKDGENNIFFPFTWKLIKSFLTDHVFCCVL